MYKIEFCGKVLAAETVTADQIAEHFKNTKIRSALQVLKIEKKDGPVSTRGRATMCAMTNWGDLESMLRSAAKRALAEIKQNSQLQ